ncbi:type IV pilus biogenesis/stability protein PilW [Casimicrobium huifangae]|uniref:type IV pilus biogenesis/stability protein PilW n=1 Tax=Casimicrobium huifangae TaxID=2591109 RepID=UPI0012EBB299|nr:type IV pilus biogenesis/stability protein PilW [Casimicrobium huifangae]
MTCATLRLSRTLRLVALGVTGVAMALLTACGNLSKKEDDSAQAAAPGGEDPLRYRAKVHTELGANYFQRGQMSVALEELREAIRLDPKYGVAHSILGLVHADLGEFAKADAAFQQAVAMAPAEGDIRNNYGSYLCRQGRPKEGLEQFDAALRLPLYQTPQVALENAGSCALAASMIRPAETYFARLVQIQPFYSRGYQGLAAVGMKTARFDEVRKQVRMALSAQPLTAELYYYGACAERQLGDRAAEDSYVQQLKSRFADSPLNARLQKGVCE